MKKEMADKKVKCNVCKGTISIDAKGVVRREYHKSVNPTTNWPRHDCVVQKRPSEIEGLVNTE